MRSNVGPPMTLANMRQNGVHAVTATCQACGREADVNVDALAETVTVPKGRPAPTVQPLRREDDIDPTRVAYRHPPLRRPTRLARTTADVLGAIDAKRGADNAPQEISPKSKWHR
jgi:hypothetical protein